MPTLVQRYINPASSGGDGTTNATSGANAAFASMNAAGNAISGRDLVTNDELWQFECATTGGAADATQVITLGSGAGIVTDATRYVRFYPAAGHEALATGWDANRYRLSTSSTVGILFALGVENILFEDLQLECTADDSDGEIVRASGTFGATFGVRFIGCRLRGASGQTNPREAARVTSWSGKWVFANCVFERFATAVLCHFPGASTQLVVHNCTAAGVTGGNGIEFFGSGLDSTTILSVRNTILYGFDADFSVTLGGASNESANNLATDPTFTNAGSGDYSIGTGSAAEDAGGDLSANTRYAVTVDIAGTARPQNSVFDIGAFEIVAGGGGLALLLFTHERSMEAIRQKGATDQSVELLFLDTTTGAGKTGLAAAGMDIKYHRPGSAATALTESDLGAIGSAHSDGGVFEIGNGLYRVDLPDAALATGVDRVTVFGTGTGSVIVPLGITLVSFDPIAAGITAADVRTEIDSNSTKLAAIETDTQDLQARIPAALVSGRIDASVGAMAANVVTASAVAADAVTELQSGLATSAALATSDGKLDTLLGADVVYKKNTAVTAFGFYMENTDGTPGTGLTVTVQVSKDGAAFATVAGAVTEISGGFYKVNLTATELNADEVLVKATAAGARTTAMKIRTQA
jgi:hypothetical protein